MIHNIIPKHHKRQTFVTYSVCRLMNSVVYVVCCLMTFVAYSVCRLLTFVGCRVCRLIVGEWIVFYPYYTV